MRQLLQIQSGTVPENESITQHAVLTHLDEAQILNSFESNERQTISKEDQMTSQQKQGEMHGMCEMLPLDVPWLRSSGRSFRRVDFGLASRNARPKTRYRMGPGMTKPQHALATR